MISLPLHLFSLLFQCSLVLLNSRNKSQLLVSEEKPRIGIGILRLVLRNLAGVGMKIDDMKLTFVEKLCCSRSLSLYSRWNIKLWPCF